MLPIRLQIKLKINSVSVASLLLGIYYLWFFLPYMRTTFTGIYKYFFFAFFVAGIALLVFENLCINGLKIKVKPTILSPIIIYMIAMVFLVLLGIKDAGDHIRVSFTFWGTAFVYYLMGVHTEGRRKFGIFLLIITVFTIITSSIGVWFDPSASRALANSSQSAEALKQDYILGRKNISSLYLFQSIAIFSPVFIMLVKKKHVLTGLLGLMLSFVIILNASFTICLAVWGMGIVFGMFYRKSISNVVITSSLFVLVLLLPWASILDRFATVIDNSYISHRLREMITLITLGEAVGNTAGRIDAYMRSIETIIKHPIGVGAYYTQDIISTVIGRHSQILDDLARYGIFALTFYVLFFKRYFVLIRDKWKKVGMADVALPILIQYIALLLLNIGFKSAEESVIMLFVLPELPEIYLYFKEKR